MNCVDLLYQFYLSYFSYKHYIVDGEKFGMPSVNDSVAIASSSAGLGDSEGSSGRGRGLSSADRFSREGKQGEGASRNAIPDFQLCILHLTSVEMGPPLWTYTSHLHSGYGF